MMVRITYQTVTIALTIFIFLVMPLIVTMMRSAVRWSKIESKVDTIIHDLERIVKSQDTRKDETDKVHTEMLNTMRDDRAATDRRLRWLEEHLWKAKS